MTAATRARRRAKARLLAEQGLSNRTIAKRVGVSESTVRRWRAEDRAAECVTAAPEGAPPAAEQPAAPDALTVPYDDALRDDMAVLTAAGLAPDAAVMLAVQLLADAYRTAWDYGLYARDERPAVRARPHRDGRELGP